MIPICIKSTKDHFLKGRDIYCISIDDIVVAKAVLDVLYC